MKYLKLLPKIYYDVTDNSILNYVTNIISSTTIGNNFLENTSVYYTYDIRDGDTPDNLAAKFYDSSDRYWIIFLMNNIIDPQYDWPLQYDEFNRYIDNKYSKEEYANNSIEGSGIEWAKNISNKHSYYKVITKTTNDIITITKLEVDSNTYANDELMEIGLNENIILENGTTLNYKISKEYKTYYDYEFEENEKKRNIKLLKKEFVSILENEIKELYQQ